MSEPKASNLSNKNCKWRFAVAVAGCLLLVFTVALSWLAQSFPFEQVPGRPIVVVVWVCWLACAVALVALVVGLQIPVQKLSNPNQFFDKQLFSAVVLFSIVFRLILIFSSPILEVDYYRYLWDGVVANQGVSPYRFSPETVLTKKSDDLDLQKLQQLIAEKPTLKTLVSRVHFEEYTTLYPPISQLVFQATSRLTPDDASVETHIIAIKSALILFDLGVVFCLAWMLSFLGKHPAWLMAYAWNPLVLKEIANGGHLDSIAIFFMTAGIGVFLWGVQRIGFEAGMREIVAAKTRKKTQSGWWACLSGALIGLGIGAKLFPVIFVPALVFFLVAKRLWKETLGFACSCAIVSTLAMWPMFGSPDRWVDPEINHSGQAKLDQQINDEEMSTKNEQSTNDGLTVFITQWRMNDAIFSFIYQNVEYDWTEHGPAWYVFVPNETRVRWCRELSETKFAKSNPAYFVARMFTVGLFGVFYLWILLKLYRTDSALDLAGWLFLIMGVFFYLQPTQNPWYWLWAMPLVCFAKNRGWLLVSMILFVYYLRFWYTEQEHQYEFWGAIYVGYDFYDHCIVWIEFAVVLTVLFLFRFARGKSKCEAQPSSISRRAPSSDSYSA